MATLLKNNLNKVISVLLTVCLLVGVVAISGINSSAAYATEYCWSFEDGTISPFTLVSGKGGKEIGNRTTEINNPLRPINKHGDYYLNTVETETGGYSNTIVATYQSTSFYIYDTKVTLKIAGGANISELYVAVCSKDGTVLAKTSPQAYPGTQSSDKSGAYIFQDATIDLTGKVTSGQEVYIKIVDNTTVGWGFIAVDEIRFTGVIPGAEIEDQKWSFEDGTTYPFSVVETNDTDALLIGKRSTDFNGSVNIQKDGEYYLTTTEVSAAPGYKDGITCVLRSLKFSVDVKHDATVKFKIGGGAHSTELYIALYKADGTLLKTASPASSAYVLQEQSWDLSDAGITSDDLLYMEIVDSRTGGWGNLIVDDIRFRGCVPVDMGFKNEAAATEITGWNQEKFDALTASVQNLCDSFGEIYPNGHYFLKQINSMAELHKRFYTEDGYTSLTPEVQSFAADMEKLKTEIAKENPYIAGSQMLFVTRNQYRMDHHNTHTMFPSYAGEFNNGSYTGGGTVKIMDFANGGTVTTLLSDNDGVFRDPDISYDGDKLLLSYRQNWGDSYHIYEYSFNDTNTAVTLNRKLTSMYGADDMDPMYMPSGNIVFTSTRDPKYVQCNRHISANIYRMESDGANILQLTNNTLFDRVTDILPDGRILYDRWEYVDRDFASAQGLWTVCEDGTEQITYYGNNSPTGATIDAKVIPGTNKVAAILTSCHDIPWGALAIIDRTNGVDGNAPVVQTWPASAKSGIKDAGAASNVDAYLKYSIKYEDPQPLDENYLLVSRQVTAGGKMGIFLVDTFGNETLLYEDSEGLGAFDAVLVQPRVKENVIYERRDYTSDSGKFIVQNVYEGTDMQGVEKGTVKTLRIVEVMSKYNLNKEELWKGEGQQNPGVNWHSFEVKRVIGEVPVYEDGSAYFTVPENTFVYFQLLDKDGRMIQSMRSGTLVQSGETVSCVGCHENRATSVPDYNTKTLLALTENFEVIENKDYVEGSGLPKTIGINTPDTPKKRTLNFETGIDTLTEVDLSDTDSLPTMNYLTEVQPIFTANCLECHGYDKKEADLTLVPDKGTIFNASYVDLWRNRRTSARFGNYLGVIGGGSTEFADAKSWGSYASPLVNKIFNDADHSKLLTDAEKRRIAEWVDLNATYYGDYSTNYPDGPGGRSPLSYSELSQIPGYVWGSNANWGISWGIVRAMPIYFDNPEKSPVLKNLSGDDYTKALAMIQLGHDRLKANPDVDWAGLTSMPGNTSVTITPYAMRAEDKWRMEKVQLRKNIQQAVRYAIANGLKHYDSDNTVENGLPDWPTTAFPGWGK